MAICPGFVPGDGFCRIFYVFKQRLRRFEKEQPVLLDGAARAGSNVILTLILIPRIGVMGAALATLASYILVFFVRAVSIRRLLPFPLAVPIVTLDAGLLSAQALLAFPLISRWFPRWASCWFPAQAPLVFLLLILNAKPLLLTAKKLFGARRKGESV